MNIKNIFNNLDLPESEEIFEELAKNKHFKFEKIISYSQITPKDEWYDQNHNEWVMLLKGDAKLRFENPVRIIHLKEGDYLTIHAHNKHRVEYTSKDAMWLALHY